MPQPAGPQDAEAFVGRSRELAVLSAALRQAADSTASSRARPTNASASCGPAGCGMYATFPNRPYLSQP